MFIKIHQVLKCSQCGAADYYETVYRGNLKIIRCRNCGHEHIETIENNSMPKHTIKYEKKTDDIIEF